MNQDCIDSNCEKRHPLPCRYGSQCIFGQNCSFSHGNKDVGLNVNKENKLEEYVGRHKSLNLGSRDYTNESDVEEMISEEENEDTESIIESSSNDSMLSC